MGQHKRKPNGVLQFPTSRVAGEMANAAVRRNRGWKQIMFGQFTPSVDINAPPAYVLDVQGQRSDDVVFTVRVALDKRKIDLVPSALGSMNIAVGSMNDALRQLQTFRDCSCTMETSCEEHQKQ